MYIRFEEYSASTKMNGNRRTSMDRWTDKQTLTDIRRNYYGHQMEQQWTSDEITTDVGQNDDEHQTKLRWTSNKMTTDRNKTYGDGTAKRSTSTNSAEMACKI